MPLQNVPRSGERFLVPARLCNEGGFPHETIYRLKMANGKHFEHIGFTSYTFSPEKTRHPDIHRKGEEDGFIEVIFYEIDDKKAKILPPQAHGCDWSGFLFVAYNDLQLIPRREWNNHDSYGT